MSLEFFKQVENDFGFDSELFLHLRKKEYNRTIINTITWQLNCLNDLLIVDGYTLDNYLEYKNATKDYEIFLKNAEYINKCNNVSPDNQIKPPSIKRHASSLPSSATKLSLPSSATKLSLPSSATKLSLPSSATKLSLPSSATNSPQQSPQQNSNHIEMLIKTLKNNITNWKTCNFNDYRSFLVVHSALKSNNIDIKKIVKDNNIEYSYNKLIALKSIYNKPKNLFISNNNDAAVLYKSTLNDIIRTKHLFYKYSDNKWHGYIIDGMIDILKNTFHNAEIYQEGTFNKYSTTIKKSTKIIREALNMLPITIFNENIGILYFNNIVYNAITNEYVEYDNKNHITRNVINDEFIYMNNNDICMKYLLKYFDNNYEMNRYLSCYSRKIFGHYNQNIIINIGVDNILHKLFKLAFDDYVEYIEELDVNKGLTYEQSIKRLIFITGKCNINNNLIKTLLNRYKININDKLLLIPKNTITFSLKTTNIVNNENVIVFRHTKVVDKKINDIMCTKEMISSFRNIIINFYKDDNNIIVNNEIRLDFKYSQFNIISNKELRQYMIYKQMNVTNMQLRKLKDKILNTFEKTYEYKNNTIRGIKGVKFITK
jgi:hypothetical protein